VPEPIVIDNGTEFTTRAVDQSTSGSTSPKGSCVSSRRTNGQTNGEWLRRIVQSFHGKFRENAWTGARFLTVEDTRETIEEWSFE
jgi:hypothetical protein